MSQHASRPAVKRVDLCDEEEFELVRRIGAGWRELRRGAAMGTFREQIYGSGDDSLDPGQVDSLDLLVQKESWRMTDLAEALRVDPSTATRAVQRLVRTGLASRHQGPDDGRVVMVAATDEGRDRQKRLERVRRYAMSVMLAEFDRSERDALADLMERLVQALDHLTTSAERCIDASIQADIGPD